jgi:FkbM family methyltransferase
MRTLEKFLNSKQMERFRRFWGKHTGIYLRLKRFTPSASEDMRNATILNSLGIKYVLDVGANTGQFAESLFDFNYRGTVISFEPVGSCYEALVKRSEKNKNHIVAERCAIGDQDMEIQINVSDDSVFSSVLEIKDEHTKLRPKSRIVRQETVNLYKLDTIIDKYIPKGETSVLLKIDTQGFEKQVLDGALNSIARFQGIKIEIPLVPIYSNTRFTFYEIIDFMKERGFTPYNFNTEGVNLKTGRVFTIDGMFFRESGD